MISCTTEVAEIVLQRPVSISKHLGTQSPIAWHFGSALHPQLHLLWPTVISQLGFDLRAKRPHAFDVFLLCCLRCSQVVDTLLSVLRSKETFHAILREGLSMSAARQKDQIGSVNTVADKSTFLTFASFRL